MDSTTSSQRLISTTTSPYLGTFIVSNSSFKNIRAYTNFLFYSDGFLSAFSIYNSTFENICNISYLFYYFTFRILWYHIHYNLWKCILVWPQLFEFQKHHHKFKRSEQLSTCNFVIRSTSINRFRDDFIH